MKRTLRLSIYSLFICSTCTFAQDSAKNVTHDVNTEPHELTEINIYGALSPLGLERMGKPVSIITHKELQERSEPTIGEMLSSEPGVSSSYFGPGASRPVIRGQSKQRVRVVENGLENGDASSISDDHAVSIDPLSVQRVDILRGPSTLLYGSSAIGGVVNMIDESITEDGVGKPFTGEIDLRKADEADEEGSGSVSLNGQAGKINWHFSSYYRETDDIEIPGYAESERLREQEAIEEEEYDKEDEVKGKLENSATLSKGFKAGTTYVFDRAYLGLAVRVNSSKYGVPGGHDHTDEHVEEGDPFEESHLEEGLHEDDPALKIDLDQTRLESRGELKLDNSFFETVRFGASFSDYSHKEIEGGETGTKFDNNSFEGRAELTHRHAEDFEGSLGTQVKYDDFKAEGEEAFIPKSKTFNPALFIVEDFKLTDKLVWQVGGRYEYSNINPEDIQDKDYNMISASTGFVRSLDDDFSLGLTFAYSERPPTSTELFADGAHLATQSFEIGDPNLSKEKSFGSELVLRKSNGKFTGSAGVFWQHYFDYINLAPNGEEEDGLPVYLYGITRARFWGFEAEADYALLQIEAQSLVFYNQIDYVRGDNLSDNDPLPRITPLRGKSGLKYQYEDFSSYVEGIFVDEQDKTAEFELPTDSYTLLNAGISYQLPSSGQNKYELYLRGTNLTDEEARVHTSFLKDVAPLRGRALLAGFSFNF